MKTDHTVIWIETDKPPFTSVSISLHQCLLLLTSMQNTNRLNQEGLWNLKTFY